jgi:hypothetical protein
MLLQQQITEPLFERGGDRSNLPVVTHQVHDCENVVEAFRGRLAVSDGRRGPHRNSTKYFAVHGDQVITGILDWRSSLYPVLKQPNPGRFAGLSHSEG